jgi:peptidoglycan/LPS O-acetylase OafA/YrhL
MLLTVTVSLFWPRLSDLVDYPRSSFQHYALGLDFSGTFSSTVVVSDVGYLLPPSQRHPPIQTPTLTVEVSFYCWLPLLSGKLHRAIVCLA